MELKGPKREGVKVTTEKLHQQRRSVFLILMVARGAGYAQFAANLKKRSQIPLEIADDCSAYGLLRMRSDAIDASNSIAHVPACFRRSKD